MTDDERDLVYALRCQVNLDEGNCPACGDPSPNGHTHTEMDMVVVLLAHNDNDHSLCAYSI